MGYNRARYYHYDLGRFIQRDPIDIADDVNLYTYVANNPLIYTDRMGLEKGLIISINQGSILTPYEYSFAEKAALGYIDFGRGVYQGDYNSNQNGYSIAGQIMTGIVPGVGQVADVRDLAFNVQNPSAVGISLSLVAFVPLAGDGIKQMKNIKAPKGVKSQIKVANEHITKLKKYIENPDKYDDGRLLAAGDNLLRRNSIINGRIRHLQNEINAAKKNIKDLIINNFLK